MCERKSVSVKRKQNRLLAFKIGFVNADCTEVVFVGLCDDFFKTENKNCVYVLEEDAL